MNSKSNQQENQSHCRIGCGACCIVPSISSPIPGMPQGKPSGIPCIQLDEQNRCKLFGLPERPAVCLKFKPCAETCGQTNDDAFVILNELEQATQ